MLISPGLFVGVALLFGAVGMAGVFLDTAWHRTIGRDSLFILPHLFIYAGGFGIWAAAIGSFTHATLGRVADFGGWILTLGHFRLPFGFAVAALGVLIVGAAAPVDVWWHWMYGKDALIWSFSHLMGHFGAGVTAIGLLFAVAAQAGRGVFRRAWLWRLAMLAVFVDLIHRALFVQAHYTMIPQTRTPDFYPYLSSLLLPMMLVAAARVLGPWAPTAASLGFLMLALVTDGALRLIEFERYTITPIVAIPALAVTLISLATARHGSSPGAALASGLAFALIFTVVEALWMAHVVGRPWPRPDVLGGLPSSLLVGGASGWVGWVLGGFLVASGTGSTGPVSSAPGTPLDVGIVFGSRGRARTWAALALALGVAGLWSTYRPQRFGSPMAVHELGLAPLESLRYQEAIFWDVILDDGWRSQPRVEARSEGIIDGAPLPVGPAWCAPTAQALATELTGLRFSLAVNGVAVDLSPYPLMRLPMRDGTHCGWVGVASMRQRASENRFVYMVERTDRQGTNHRTEVVLHVVFKDP